MVFIVCEEKNVPSSNSVKLKSVSVVSFEFVSIGNECISISKFCSVGDASKHNFVLDDRERKRANFRIVVLQFDLRVISFQLLEKFRWYFL